MKLSDSQNIFHYHSSQRKGFSLVEVIIAIGIVALLLTGFLGVFGSAQKNINRSLGVREANLLKDALENEMSVYRSTDTGYDSAFHKAFEMIKNSNSASSAILMYQYKANPVDTNDDGILPVFTDNDGIPGSSYITQVAVRKRGVDNDLMKNELSGNTVLGNVYAVRLTQLISQEITDETTNTPSIVLQLSEEKGKILHKVGGIFEEVDDYEVYNEAVITFQAEFFRLPSNASGFVTGGNWVFEKDPDDNSNKISLGNPVAVVNMAILRR